MNQSEVKVVGLNISGVFTCEDENCDAFWIKSGLSADRFKALWDWAKSDPTFWKDGWTGITNIKEVYKNDGHPIQRIVELKQS